MECEMEGMADAGEKRTNREECAGQKVPSGGYPSRFGGGREEAIPTGMECETEETEAGLNLKMGAGEGAREESVWRGFWAKVVDSQEKPRLGELEEGQVNFEGETPAVKFNSEAIKRLEEPFKFAAIAGLFGGGGRLENDYSYVFSALQKQWGNVKEPTFLHSGKWKLPQLPIHLWNEYCYKGIAKAIRGEYVEEDSCSGKWEKVGFARVKLEVPINFLPVPSVSLDLGDGRRIIQEVVYESRISFCDLCGALTHTRSSCKKLTVGETATGNPWARVKMATKTWKGHPREVGLSFAKQAGLSDETVRNKSKEREEVCTTTTQQKEQTKGKGKQSENGRGSAKHPPMEPNPQGSGTSTKTLSPNPFYVLANDKKIDDPNFPPCFTFESGSSAMGLNLSGIGTTGTKIQDKVVRGTLINGEGCQVISEAWGAVVQGCPMLLVFQKLEVVKHSLIYWNKNSFGRIEDNIKSLQSRLSQAQANSEAGDGWATREEESIKRHLEEIMWKEKSRVKCAASVKSITNIKRVLSQLEERIGFIINNSKSSLFTFNVDTPLEQRLANIGGWQAAKLPLEYLGVPLFTGNLSANLCAGLIAKFEKKLAPWKTQLVSYAGCGCLIAHNLSSMGNFWMQVFSLPNEVLKKLEQCMAGFLWADTEVNRHIHQIAWHTFCKPKAEGGIGLRLLEEVNVSLLASRLCSSFNNNSLFAQWIRTTYLKSNSLWTVRKPWRGSWAWKSLGKGWNKVANWVRWKIGDDNSVFFWSDWWHDEILVKSISGEEYGVIVYQLKLSVAEVRSLGEARLTLPSKALTASMSIQLANETDKLVSNATELKDLSSRSIWDAIRQKGSQEEWNEVAHERLTTTMSEHIFTVVWSSAKEAFQRLQLKEDERKAMSTWLRTGILCEGRLSSLSMNTNVLQIVTYKKSITIMVMGMWRLRDMESIEAIFTEAQSREDEAELQVLNGWVQSMVRVNGSLGIISNNEGWKRRLRAMLEGRRPISQK
ncbi:putative ribonuclease H protein [Nymphaea thermarum]|nr:putative ribonuclease H protein [Nymphaea thermarum]